MFDTIGRDLDEETNKRRAQSLLLSLLLGGAAVGFVVGITAYTAAELVTDTTSELDMDPVVLLDADDTLEQAPSLPPPPPPPAAAKAEVEPEDDVEPEPDPDATPETLTEPPPDTMRSAARPDGVEGGQDGGDPDGELNGIPGGTPGGTGDTLGGDGPRIFHHSDLETRRRIQPRYPKAAKSMNLGEQRCRAIVQIDPTGTPTHVEVEGCPSVFHGPTKEALLKWRWYPPRDGRRKVRGQTVIAITYTLR